MPIAVACYETLSPDARVSASALDLLADGATLYAAAGDNGLTAIDIHDRAPRVIGRESGADDGVAIFASSIDARSGDASFIAGKR